ncbi:hypothetical protein EDB85DRAFT_1502913 [Lactarius pseudohatsudake]|nr:hypothetical protein EDB85DRAFT_1502913 [Lactarius pseudohatsudake]
MALSKFQLEESKKLNPRYVLELHTIRGMIQEADSMDKGLRTVLGLKLARQGNAPVPQQPQPHSMDPTPPSFVAPPARRKVSNKANSLEVASTAPAVTSTPTFSTRTKGGVKRIREDVADGATLGVASAPSPKRVKTDLEGPLNEEAQNHGEASRECQDRGS